MLSRWWPMLKSRCAARVNSTPEPGPDRRVSRVAREDPRDATAAGGNFRNFVR